MTLVMSRGPKMIEAICPGCFKSFTKIGSMHRHIYEDRCRSPVPRFVKKIKAEHGARVAAAAARSAARAATRGASAAAPAPVDPHRPEQRTNPSDQGGGQEETDQLQPSFKIEDGTSFAQKRGLEQHTSRTGGYFMAQQPQWQPQDFGSDCFNTNWTSFNYPWVQGWQQTQPQVLNWLAASSGCA